MRSAFSTIFLFLLVLNSLSRGAEVHLTSPLEYQVVQRSAKDQGTLRIAGLLSEDPPSDLAVDVRLSSPQAPGTWQRMSTEIAGREISGSIDAKAGGWYKLEVRISHHQNELAKSLVQHVGIGEVFVIAGQSNSANHSEEKLVPQTGRVSAFDGNRWQIAKDPQPGASGKSGSFLPAFGDIIVEKLDVPVGIVACGIGSSSVREWLPKGSTFPNPPTIVSRVEELPNGGWTSKGDAFNMFVNRMKPLGPNGFRAVLWHQGESDANQKDPTRTLEGSLYRKYLEKVIQDSRRDIGWNAPWFVAQVSYHVPGDEAAPEIREAQASLWRDGIAVEGPDSDAMKGELRERNGQGVHFSGKGQRVHGARWADKVIPWLEKQ